MSPRFVNRVRVGRIRACAPRSRSSLLQASSRQAKSSVLPDLMCILAVTHQTVGCRSRWSPVLCGWKRAAVCMGLAPQHGGFLRKFDNYRAWRVIILQDRACTRLHLTHPSGCVRFASLWSSDLAKADGRSLGPGRCFLSCAALPFDSNPLAGCVRTSAGLVCEVCSRFLAATGSENVVASCLSIPDI